MKNIESTPSLPERKNETLQTSEYNNEHERLRSERERAVEHAKNINPENARREALENASSIERPSDPDARREVITRPTRVSKEQSFQHTINDARRHMSPIEKSFSKIIHNKAIENTSELAAKTVARPNAIASGAFSAFIFTLVIYLVAKKFGYPLSGSETIGAFILGWAIGLAYDLVRAMLSGRSKY